MEYLHFSPEQYNFSSFEEYLLALSLEYSLISVGECLGSGPYVPIATPVVLLTPTIN